MRARSGKKKFAFERRYWRGKLDDDKMMESQASQTI